MGLLKALGNVSKRGKSAFSHLRDRSGRFAFNGGRKRSALAINNHDVRAAGNRVVRRRERFIGAAQYARQNPAKVAGFAVQTLKKTRGYNKVRNGVRNVGATVILNTTSSKFRQAVRVKKAQIVGKVDAFAQKHNLGANAKQWWTGVTPGKKVDYGFFVDQRPDTHNPLNGKYLTSVVGGFGAGYYGIKSVQSMYRSQRDQQRQQVQK